MEALFIVLNDLTFMDDILDKFIELHIKGATIIDSQGMAQAIIEKDGGGQGFILRSILQSFSRGSKSFEIDLYCITRYI